MRWRSFRVVIPIALLAILLTIYLAPELAAFVYEVIAFLTPIWLPVLLAYIAWPLWFTYARSRYVASIPYVTMEMHPGPETPRTAKPMELVFYSLYHRTEVTKRDFLFGYVRLPWSFEVCAHNGTVRFFLHVPETSREALEARVRAEYHDIEIDAARDYSREISFSPSRMRLAACEYTLSKPDPYPLQTYAQHEAASPRKDAFAEMLGSIAGVGKGEHVLISYLIRPHQRERTSYFEDPKDSVHQDAYKVIAELVGKEGATHSLPAGKQAVVAAIEAGLRKPLFDCGIRALYIADKNEYNQEFAQKLPTLFAGFNDSDLNGFSASDPADNAGFLARELYAVFPHAKAAHLLHLYRQRAFFAAPYIGNAFVLNTEELATVFHMPYAGRGSVIAHRESVRLEPPENLPV